MERKGVYMFATKPYYTEGYSEQVFEDDVRPQIPVAVADELRTVQLNAEWMSQCPDGKRASISAVAYITPLKVIGFTPHYINMVIP